MEIKLEITKEGGIQMLHSDEVDLSQFGDVSVSRASHVEWRPGGWYVRSARTGFVLRDHFPSRANALAWEKAHYSPGGNGWAELCERDEPR